MTRDQAVQRIQRQMGFTTQHAGIIIDALQDAQQELELERVLPWFLQSEIAQRSTTKNEERVPLPERFIREVEEAALWVYDPGSDLTSPSDDDWKELKKDDHDKLRRQYQGTGKPEAYFLDADYFRLFPVPDDVYILKMRYYRKDAVLDSNIENEWLANIPGLLIGVAGQKVAHPVRDKSAFEYFVKEEADGRALLLDANEARKSVNWRYVMGGED